jgi:hypothetical protein
MRLGPPAPNGAPLLTAGGRLPAGDLGTQLAARSAHGLFLRGFQVKPRCMVLSIWAAQVAGNSKSAAAVRGTHASLTTWLPTPAPPAPYDVLPWLQAHAAVIPSQPAVLPTNLWQLARSERGPGPLAAPLQRDGTGQLVGHPPPAERSNRGAGAGIQPHLPHPPARQPAAWHWCGGDVPGVAEGGGRRGGACGNRAAERGACAAGLPAPTASSQVPAAWWAS